MRSVSPKAGSSFVRRMQIITTLSTGRGYTIAELSQLFGVSRRTLFRDLKEIQSVGVVPQCSRTNRATASAPRGQAKLAEVRSRKGGYTVASSPENGLLPPVNLNLQEALGLLLLAHKLWGQLQLPFKHSALMAALKIESSLPPRIRRFCEHALAKISAKASAQASAPTTPGLDSVFSALQSALAQRRKVYIRYDSLFDGGAVDCNLSPYHLFYNQRAWYVIGHSSAHKMVRTFKLNRIKEVTTLDDKFTEGDNFDLAEYLGRAWSMIPEGRIFNVRLKFTPKVANNVAEVQWHSTQKVIRSADGSAIIEFRVDGLGEITWWILGYGDQVKVLAPLSLRSKVVEIARRMAEINNGSTI